MSSRSSGFTAAAASRIAASLTELPAARKAPQLTAAFGTSSPTTITWRSSGSRSPGSRASTAGSASRRNDAKSIFMKRSASTSALQSACFRQNASSAALNRVFTGTVTAPISAAP